MKLNSELILHIHTRMCEKFSAPATLRDEGLFKGLCDEPYQEVFGQVLYPSVYDKAAKYLEGFAHYQVFTDGNKRTGFGSMLAFLEISGQHFAMTQKDAFEFVMDVVQRKLRENTDIAEVIGRNCIPADNACRNDASEEITLEALDGVIDSFAKRYQKTFIGLAAGEAFDVDAFFAE